jgi:hypothetical protein
MEAFFVARLATAAKSRREMKIIGAECRVVDPDPIFFFFNLGSGSKLSSVSKQSCKNVQI